MIVMYFLIENILRKKLQMLENFLNDSIFFFNFVLIFTNIPEKQILQRCMAVQSTIDVLIFFST